MGNWSKALSDYQTYRFQDDDARRRERELIEAMVDQIEDLSARVVFLEGEIQRLEQVHDRMDEIERKLNRAEASEGW